jgi:copper homeostasis protein
MAIPPSTPPPKPLAPSSVLVEACVDSVASAVAAVEGGAARLELCAGLVEGGLTPSAGMQALVRELVPVPIHVLIRPRGGDFLYDDGEMAVMLRDIADALRLGAGGVVLGVLNGDGRVDIERTRALIVAARPMSVTFHRAFDLSRDPAEALDALIALGVERVLTSGQAATAEEGMPVIARVVRQAAGRIAVLAGGGIDERNAARIVRETGVREVHVRGSRLVESAMTFRRAGVFMGKRHEPDEYRRVETVASRVRAVVASLTGRTV